jgi:2'-5' RNA ligase
VSVPRNRAARPEARLVRLFIAFDMPAEILGALAAAVEPFRDRVPGARWTRPEGWHVTLKFLGATWPRLLEWVRSGVAGVAAAASPVTTRLSELGAFPSPTRARVLWAGLEDPAGALADLARALDESLAAHFHPEKRPYTPHLTVARLNPPSDVRRAAPDLLSLPVRSDSFLVDRVVLYRSLLSPRGATYQPLEWAPIGAPTGTPR